MSNTVLHIDASARVNGSVSRPASAHIVSELAPKRVIRRDLANGVSLLNETWVGATFTPPENRNSDQVDALSESDVLVAEIQQADTIVIGTPIYNFQAPAALKAWIDQIARAGVTFQYTENGPKGLLEGKKVIIVVSSGGVKLGTPADFVSPYLKFVMGFLGITDVTVMDPEEAHNFQQAVYA